MMDSTTIARTNGSIQDVSSSLLVQQIQQASINLRTTTKGGIVDEDSRKVALSLAKELVLALEKPEDVVMRYVFEVPGFSQIYIYLIIDWSMKLTFFSFFLCLLARGALHSSSPRYWSAHLPYLGRTWRRTCVGFTACKNVQGRIATHWYVRGHQHCWYYVLWNTGLMLFNK